MLRVQDLTKTFATDLGTVHAVDGISFATEPSEFYTLLGPSGCGKTTTLQCIAGLEIPNEGEIGMGDDLVFSTNPRVRVPADRRDVGVVFQSYAVWPHMTVYKNVAFPLVYGRRRLPRSEVREAVMRTLSLVELDGLADRPTPLLSGGQQQRVALARAVVHEPKLLLLDEPLSNLDAKLREGMRLELRQLVRRLGITTLYVTHDQVEALTMSDRIAIMRDGKIVQEGTPHELYFTPRDEFVANFLGRSNFLDGVVVSLGPAEGCGLVDTAIGSIHSAKLAAAQERDRVLVAIRPEGITIGDNAVDGPMVNRMRGRIERVIFGGDFLECEVRVNDQLLRAKLDPYQDVREDQVVDLSLPAERCISFTG